MGSQNSENSIIGLLVLFVGIPFVIWGECMDWDKSCMLFQASVVGGSLVVIGLAIWLVVVVWSNLARAAEEREEYEQELWEEEEEQARMWMGIWERENGVIAQEGPAREIQERGEDAVRLKRKQRREKELAKEVVENDDEWEGFREALDRKYIREWGEFFGVNTISLKKPEGDEPWGA